MNLKNFFFYLLTIGIIFALFLSISIFSNARFKHKYKSHSPYDTRGLTIDPNHNEPKNYQKPRGKNRQFLNNHPIRRNFNELIEPRMVPEWEPVQAALIRYPMGISVDTVKLIAEKLKVYVLCESKYQNSAHKIFKNNNVTMKNIEFITAVTDTYWTRDYSAIWIETGTFDNRTTEPVDAIYRKNGFRPNDDRVPVVIANYFKLPRYYSLNYVLQGGNLMADGYSSGASTNRILDENKNYNINNLQDLAEQFLGFERYFVLDDPAYPNDYIKHIDCWAKFISPGKVIVKRVPTSDPNYSKFEKAANNWANTKNAYGGNYKVIRVDGPSSAPYVNHIILNNRVLVPIIGNPTYDNVALTQIQMAYGRYYTVYPVEAAPNLPWLGTDSIHCRINTIPEFHR